MKHSPQTFKPSRAGTSSCSNLTLRSASIWHLAPLLEWFVRHQDYDIAKPMLDVAQVTMQLDAAKQAALVAEETLKGLLLEIEAFKPDDVRKTETA